MRSFARAASAAAVGAMLGCFAAPAGAAELPVKARPVLAPEAAAWDIAFGGGIASDYIFRGITQSNHRPSVSAYFEPRYNVDKDLQFYIGVGGASIDFPNRAAAEVDVYGGIRPTFGPLALDFGLWLYAYPGGKTFNGLGTVATCTNGEFGFGGFCNTLKGNVTFFEAYAKANYNITDALVVGANFYYTPSFLSSGAPGEYVSGIVKYTLPALTGAFSGVTPYVSGEFGRQFLGTTDSFYGTPAFPGGIKYADYNTWNVGFGWTWNVFTVDLRYVDTDLSKSECNAFTGDFNPSGPSLGNVSAINPSGFGSNWCGARFFARISADLTVNTNLK